MATRLLAPSMGEGIEELTVVNWLKKEGETVKEMEMIVELETDKVTTEIPSPAEGTLLKILAQKDQAIKVGATLAWIGQPGEALDSESPPASVSAPAPQPAAAEAPKPAGTEAQKPAWMGAPTPATVEAPVAAGTKAPTPAAAAGPKPAPAEAPGPAPTEAPQPAAAEPAPAPQNSTYTGFVSPLVKNLVAANQVDLNLVHGTGLGGRITKEDVLNYLETRKSAAPAAAAPPPVTEAAPAAATPPAAGVESAAAAAKPAALESELIPLSSLRRQIAERMVSSQHTSPHVLTVMEADLSRVLAHRLVHKADFAAQGVNLTLTAYFCSAIVSGLKACPDVNCSFTEAGLQRYQAINLGVAVALGERGLIVPVIKHAELLSLQGLAQQVNDLSGRARSKKLLPEDVRDGTFTLTNHGLGGSLFAAPIIVQPQAAILGTGMMQKRAVVVTDANGSDAIAIRPMIYLSLVFDHRILDGESADRFLKVVKETLENWEQERG